MLYYPHSFQTMGRKEYFHDYMMIYYAGRHAYMVYQYISTIQGKVGNFELIAGPASNSHMIIWGLMVSPFKDAIFIVLKLSQGFYLQFPVTCRLVITSCGHTRTCIHIIYITFILCVVTFVSCKVSSLRSFQQVQPVAHSHLSNVRTCGCWLYIVDVTLE